MCCLTRELVSWVLDIEACFRLISIPIKCKNYTKSAQIMLASNFQAFQFGIAEIFVSTQQYVDG